jgi:hypothetical protein
MLGRARAEAWIWWPRENGPMVFHNCSSQIPLGFKSGSFVHPSQNWITANTTARGSPHHNRQPWTPPWGPHVQNESIAAHT